MRNYYLLIVLFFLISCDLSKKNSEIEKKDELILYQPSELAILMEEMYQYNVKVKSQIIQGREMPIFPEKFLKIHTADMTNTFERNEPFNKYAETYIYFQKELLKSEKKDLKTNFNNTINTCVACHQTSCTGPIPRIKKLLID